MVLKLLGGLGDIALLEIIIEIDNKLQIVFFVRFLLNFRVSEMQTNHVRFISHIIGQ